MLPADNSTALTRSLSSGSKDVVDADQPQPKKRKIGGAELPPLEGEFDAVTYIMKWQQVVTGKHNVYNDLTARIEQEKPHGVQPEIQKVQEVLTELDRLYDALTTYSVELSAQPDGDKLNSLTLGGAWHMLRRCQRDIYIGILRLVAHLAGAPRLQQPSRKSKLRRLPSLLDEFAYKFLARSCLWLCGAWLW